KALAAGAAAERFARMVGALGGPRDLLERPEGPLARAPIELPVAPGGAGGFVARVDARALGLIVVDLGGGRRRVDDAVDPAVGLAHVRGVGDAVDRDRPLAIVHARSVGDAHAAAKRGRGALEVSDEPEPGSGPPLPHRVGRARPR